MAVGALISVALSAGCSQGPARHVSAPGPSARTAAVSRASPHLRHVEVFSRTYQLFPSSPLVHLQTVRLPLTRRVPPGWAVVVATAETGCGPWTYLAARLSADRRTATFPTVHHSVRFWKRSVCSAGGGPLGELDHEGTVWHQT